MRTTSLLTSLLAVWTASVAAAPQVRKGEGFISPETNNAAHNDITESVMLVPAGTSPSDILARLPYNITIVKQFSVGENLKGVVLQAGGHCADALDAMEDVVGAEEVVEIRTHRVLQPAPWGLQRISNANGASGSPAGLDFTYTFEDSSPLGSGVFVYVIDTGVMAEHQAFAGRVAKGFNAITEDDATGDVDGHGTHVSGTIAGTFLGVAQQATIVPVKVLGDNGAGSNADVIEGIGFAIEQHNQRKGSGDFRGSVINMSLGIGQISSQLDRAVREASAAGIHIALAAGNDFGADACGTSPANNGGEGSAIVTVGASNIDNRVAQFSNVGPCVDIFAPGEFIESAFPDKDLRNRTNVFQHLDGTSMAAPHVAGAMAELLTRPGNEGLINDPAGLKRLLLSTAREGLLSGRFAGAPNLLLSNGVDGRVPVGQNKRAVGSPAGRARQVVKAPETPKNPFVAGPGGESTLVW